MSFSNSMIRMICPLVLAGAALLCPIAGAQSKDAPVTTGPEIGQKIPHFEAVDQNGKKRDFESLRGRHGLLLLFVRSADW